MVEILKRKVFCHLKVLLDMCAEDGVSPRKPYAEN
jgi:predicted HicB family RNase H-like nuclease